MNLAIDILLSLLFPRMETRWLRQVLRVAIPAAVAVVRELEDRDASNEDKFHIATAKMSVVLDTAFEGVPEWRDLDVDARERIRAGLVELALFIFRVSGGKNGGRTARQAARALRQANRE